MENNYLLSIGTFSKVLGDYTYDTNDYALNFRYQPILPGIGNRDINNIYYEYQPMEDVSATEWVGDTLSNGLNAGLTTGNPYVGLAVGIATAIGKGIKQFNINKENKLGKMYVDTANAQLPIVNNYALSQTNKLDMFGHITEDGGNLHTHGGTFDNGLTYFNVGGTHGENPYGGILQGFNEEDGQPNLVEQGETKWNDYIFSNRYKAGGSLLKKYLLPDEYAGMTFAEVSKKLAEPLEDTPGSAIEKRTTDVMLGRLMNAQEEKRAKDAENQIQREFKKGGHVFLTGGDDELFPWKIPSIVDVEQDFQLQDPNDLENPYFIGPKPFDDSYIRQLQITDTIDKYKYGKNYQPDKVKYTPMRGFSVSPRDLVLADNLLSVLGDKLGITNQPDYGRSRMYRDAAMNNIRKTSVTTPYLQQYIPKELPIQSIANNYRSMLAANIAKANDVTNGNAVAALALANNATNQYYNAIGDALLNSMQYNNTENARAAELNNASRISRAQLLLNNAQFNAQQGNQLYSALRDYMNNLDVQDQLASAAQQGNLNTWREGLQNYLMESEDKDVIAQLIKSGALRYDKNSGAFYLDKYFV